MPRWALSIFWRKDGQPVWKNPALFANESEPCHYTASDAARFTATLADKLGLSPEFITPGFEDVWYYLWRERRLPVNVDPFDSKLDDAMERERLRRVFMQGLDSVVGYVLPLKAHESIPGSSKPLTGPSWTTGPWFFRDERMYLMPGDSPMGYRLPLDSVPWVSKTDYPYMIESDPFAPRDELPSTAALAGRYSAPAGTTPLAAARDSAQRVEQYLASHTRGIPARYAARRVMQSPTGNPPALSQTTEPDNRIPNAFESAAWLTRTALCVEVRDPRRANGPKASKEADAKAAGKTHMGQAERGALYIFMPPMERLEDYLDLLAAVEATAQSLDVKIVLEGYPPPRDPRLKMLAVTPDPGVIEVNIHPAYNWGELVAHTEFLYDIAHKTRLSAEKFMTDGRHTGTGGGNHFVLGGATPADSPFLRKPEVLTSLIAYWHNHPSLSYLFSGMFIGPTSQAPRVDEARNDQLYELEIAMREIAANREKYGRDMPPWIVDRTLRNILVDVTGNTHRSEFCIDKLYSPDSSTGRLGLLELRAFEMPPHARMSIAQQLLLRALVARFWNKPYHGRVTRWGTELHDRFLLPSYVRMDFQDVLTELNEAGYGFDMAWFEPHFEFRFPMIGQVKVNSIALTLRSALEPWHVMGEEGSSSGTARYVDSSLERVEVHVTGLNDNRYVVTVNGRALPLQNTGTVGEHVAGVRYKAWNPPSSLHPSIGVHAPLTFDIVDTWMERSLGGCQYHVAHPGGLSYASLPVNSYEAESRRLTRFLQMGHTPGKMQVSPAQPSREFPFTLDLR